ncbi:MAG: NAD(P)-binding domain-containing protein, partial [Clostridiales bacterium]|nr:NAD(P)-binding domain-containing protein [Clostridiales bacterium]
MDKKYKLGIIGGGNMARAIVLGALKSGLLTSKEIIVSDKVNEQLICFQGLGIDTITDNKAVASSCEYLLFAIKPQQSQAVFSEIKDCSFENAVSIMAGVTISKIRDSLGNKNIARVMTNTPALVGMGMSAIAFSDGFKSDFLLSLFSSFG